MRRESLQKRKERARKILSNLRKHYPGAKTALHFKNAHELLVSTILSAQCTDERVNMVTKELFKKYRSPSDFAHASLAELERGIRPTGFFRNKARSIRECCRDIVKRFGGNVPDNMDDLLTLRGIGRKTANVVLGTVYGKPAIVVDTHVKRISGRLGLTREKDPVKIEHDLAQILPERSWTFFSHALIRHGRTLCTARKPKCDDCFLKRLCPYP